MLLLLEIDNLSLQSNTTLIIFDEYTQVESVKLWHVSLCEVFAGLVIITNVSICIT